jgi:hypothetical protein
LNSAVVTNSAVTLSLASAAANARGAITVVRASGTTRAPFSNAPQNSNVDASNAGLASCATASRGPTRT